MTEMKIIYGKNFATSNAVHSVATVTVIVLFLYSAHGEDLITLDGKTFTNITEIAKYPNQFFFTYNGNRMSVTISNLPEGFLAKYGVTPTVATGQLLKAERAGDIETIKTFLKKGVDINSKETPDGSTVLMWAAVEGHTDMVKLLLDKGADINATNGVGMTSLMGAAGVGNIEVVKLLLARGAVGGEAAVVQLQAWLDHASGKTVSATSQPILQSTNPVDIFLALNKDSDLYVERTKEETTITLTPVQINLKAVIYESDEEIKLSLGQEVSIEQVFNKFFEWESIAKTNKAEPFDKIITRWPGSIYTTNGMRHFTFYWNSGASLGDSDGGNFSSVNVAHFSQLLKLVPDLKEELAQKIRNKEAQKDLFK